VREHHPLRWLLAVSATRLSGGARPPGAL